MATITPQKEFSPTKSVFNQIETLEINNRNNKTGCEEGKLDLPEKCVRQNIQELNLQGISRVCNPQFGTFRRVFWAFLWVVFMVSCVHNFYMCLTRLLYKPTTVDTSYVENSTITSPCVTICPTDNFFRNPAISQQLLSELGGNESYKNAYDLLAKSDMTVEELWNISRLVLPNEAYGMSQMGEGCILNGFAFSNADVEKTEIITISGVCTTYKPKVKMQCIGMQSGIAIMDHTPWNETSPYLPNMYSVIFHSEAETEMLRYYGPLLIGSFLEFGYATVAALRIQEVTLRNVLNNPCVPEEVFTKCTIRCIENNLLNESRNIKACRLPFMSESSGLSPCTTANDFLAMYTAAESTIRNFDLEPCKCRPPCNRRYYREDYYNKLKSEEMFALYVTVPRCLVERFDEQLHYDFAAFFSDVGGALGLLLGLSMLNVVEIMEIMFLKLTTVK